MECYRLLSTLSTLNETLTLRAGYTRGGEGGLSRSAQYLRYIVSNMEELRMIRDYRTPAMMRYACEWRGRGGYRTPAMMRYACECVCGGGLPHTRHDVLRL